MTPSPSPLTCWITMKYDKTYWGTKGLESFAVVYSLLRSMMLYDAVRPIKHFGVVANVVAVDDTQRAKIAVNNCFVC